MRMTLLFLVLTLSACASAPTYTYCVIDRDAEAPQYTRTHCTLMVSP